MPEAFYLPAAVLLNQAAVHANPRSQSYRSQNRPPLQYVTCTQSPCRFSPGSTSSAPASRLGPRELLDPAKNDRQPELERAVKVPLGGPDRSLDVSELGSLQPLAG